jgi:integrase
MSSTTPSKPSLADLVEVVRADASLSDTQKRDRVSALNTAAKAIGLPLADIPLELKLLRRKLEDVLPEAVGLSRARWNNIRSLVNRCLELKVALMPSQQTTAVSPAWEALVSGLARARRYKLLAMLRFLSGRGVEPDVVTLADLEAFRDQIMENRLRSGPEKTWEGIGWAWNRCRIDVAGWPDLEIPREDRRTVYVLRWSDFPASLKADVDGYLRRLSGEDIDEDGPPRAARATTLKNREYQARVAASALVAEGVAVESLKGLADIARLEPIKVIVTHVRDRGEGGHAAAASNMANFLKAVAQHWVKVDDVELAKIKRVCAKVAIRQKGMTPKNRKRLQPFNDPAFVQDFYDLPYRMIRSLKTGDGKTIPDAIIAQIAVAIAIEQVVPMRVRNLTRLDLSEHFSEQAGKVFICIEEGEVKNTNLIHMEIPGEVADLIAWYCQEYRGLLSDVPTTALFPNRTGAPKQESTLSRQISEKVMQYLGIEMNTHLFRHAAGKIYLDRHPGDYATVSRILGHKSLATTLAIYTGAETVTAGRHFQNLVGGLRSAPVATPRARRRAA